MLVYEKYMRTPLFLSLLVVIFTTNAVQAGEGYNIDELELGTTVSNDDALNNYTTEPLPGEHQNDDGLESQADTAGGSQGIGILGSIQHTTQSSDGAHHSLDGAGGSMGGIGISDIISEADGIQVHSDTQSTSIYVDAPTGSYNPNQGLTWDPTHTPSASADTSDSAEGSSPAVFQPYSNLP